MVKRKIAGSIVMIASMSGSIANKGKHRTPIAQQRKLTHVKCRIGVPRLQYEQGSSATDVPKRSSRMGAARYPCKRKCLICMPFPDNISKIYASQTVSPGYIRTAMTDQLLAVRPDLEEEWLRGSMLNRLSTPDEFRGPVLFLLSKASSFTTGADLIVDGGHTAY
jgi:hypothetical protein